MGYTGLVRADAPAVVGGLCNECSTPLAGDRSTNPCAGRNRPLFCARASSMQSPVAGSSIQRAGNTPNTDNTDTPLVCSALGPMVGQTRGEPPLQSRLFPTVWQQPPHGQPDRSCEPAASKHPNRWDDCLHNPDASSDCSSDGRLCTGPWKPSGLVRSAKRRWSGSSEWDPRRPPSRKRKASKEAGRDTVAMEARMQENGYGSSSGEDADTEMSLT